jgi:hypothetical protein
MIFYTGNLFPTWRGNALIGSLSRRGLVRIGISASNVTGEEIIPLGARIRDVEQGPDGAVYLLTDHQDGQVLRLRPPAMTDPAGIGHQAIIRVTEPLGPKNLCMRSRLPSSQARAREMDAHGISLMARFNSLIRRFNSLIRAN